MSCHTCRKYDVTEVGILHPEQTPTGILKTGQVGYIACNMKESAEGAKFHGEANHIANILHLAHVGDTLYKTGDPVQPLPGFTPAKPMVRRHYQVGADLPLIDIQGLRWDISGRIK